MPVLRYFEIQPVLGADVRLAPDAFVIGKSEIAGPAELAASAVIRGDQANIAIGRRFRLGERATVHVDPSQPTIVGDGVWVGSDAVVHGCRLGSNVRIEDGALILSRSTVGDGSVVAADSLVSEGAEFPANSYVEGTPGRRLRDTTPEERAVTERRLRQALGLPISD
jgi:carbonic anhydrase/acetyltransferase-like protein (isoleucine patch superfamily)